MFEVGSSRNSYSLDTMNFGRSGTLSFSSALVHLSKKCDSKLIYIIYLVSTDKTDQAISCNK